MTSSYRWFLHYVVLVALAIGLILNLRADDSIEFENTEFVAAEGESDIFILKFPRYAGLLIAVETDPTSLCKVLGYSSFLTGSVLRDQASKEKDPHALLLQNGKIESWKWTGPYTQQIVKQIICLGKDPRTFPGDKVETLKDPTILASNGETTEPLPYAATSDLKGVCIRMGHKATQNTILLKIEYDEKRPSIVVDDKGNLVKSENWGYRIVELQCISPVST
jgi:hypothetical protein